MPRYDMQNIKTGEVTEMVLSLSEREELLATGEYKQLLSKPNFVGTVGGTLSRTSDGWKEVLSRVKKGSGKDNTINN